MQTAEKTIRTGYASTCPRCSTAANSRNMAIPGYLRVLWQDFVSGNQKARVAEWNGHFGMQFDEQRLPLVFAGELENTVATKLLTFGLAPHSVAKEESPKNLNDWYRWRVDY